MDTLLKQILSPVMSAANISIFSDLITSFFSNPFSITTRSLSRYSSYSLRQLARFLKADIAWYDVRTLLFRKFFFDPKKTYCIATDETVEGKSGKKTHGKGYFYSSVAQMPIQSICCFVLSLVDIKTRKSHPIALEQVVENEEEKKRKKARKEEKQKTKQSDKESPKRGRGRPKNSKNKEKTAQEPQGATFRTFKTLWSKSLESLRKYMPELKISHLLADSAYASFAYMQQAMDAGIFLISKLNKNAALYELPEKPPQKKRGRPKQYGDKLDLGKLPEKYLKSTKSERDTLLQVFQFQALSKAYPKTILNVVVIYTVKNGKKTGISILFGNDLSLSADTMIDYYSLRFQIEFDFRDAKQFFGLSDFKNYKEKQVHNFTNLIFTVTLVSKKILQDVQSQEGKENFSLSDLKLYFHCLHQAKNIILLLQKQPDLIFKPDCLELLNFKGYINAA